MESCSGWLWMCLFVIQAIFAVLLRHKFQLEDKNEQLSAKRMKDSCQNFLPCIYFAVIQKKSQFSELCFRK